MAILNYGSYYSYKKKSDKNEFEEKPLKAFERLKKEWSAPQKVKKAEREADIKENFKNYL